MEITVVYTQNNKKCKNKLCGGKRQSKSVKDGGTYNYHSALQRKLPEH